MYYSPFNGDGAIPFFEATPRAYNEKEEKGKEKSEELWGQTTVIRYCH